MTNLKCIKTNGLKKHSFRGVFFGLKEIFAQKKLFNASEHTNFRNDASFEAINTNQAMFT
ncbi:hypothetical protein BM526_18915 (plasmid) [Alteromonas mediterranea]|nr:hypothetical protein BM526_18915 [Alteromonas mediterranea]